MYGKRLRKSCKRSFVIFWIKQLRMCLRISKCPSGYYPNTVNSNFCIWLLVSLFPSPNSFYFNLIKILLFSCCSNKKDWNKSDMIFASHIFLKFLLFYEVTKCITKQYSHCFFEWNFLCFQCNYIRQLIYRFKC